MSSFIVDTSDYNGSVNAANLKNNGIVGWTTKVGEGGRSDFVHSSFRTNIPAAKNIGMAVYGGYYVVRTNTGYSVQQQVNDFCSLLDGSIAGWRDDPRFICQIDLEHWDYDTVPWSYGIDFGHKLLAAVPQKAKKTFLYASEGQYGDTTTEFPLWNANYFNDSPGDYLSLYSQAGADSSFAFYGQKYKFLQYTQRASVGNGYTGDVSAFRGSVSDLETLIGIGSSAEADIM